MSGQRSFPAAGRLVAGAAALGGLGALVAASGALSGGRGSPAHDPLDAHPFAHGHADPLDPSAGWPETVSSLDPGRRELLLRSLRDWLLRRGAWMDRVRIAEAGEGKGLGLFYVGDSTGAKGGGAREGGRGGADAGSSSSSSPPRLLATFPLLSTLSLQSLALSDSTVAAMAAHSSEAFPSGEREVLTAWLAAQRALGRDSVAAPWVAAVGARQEGVGGWTPREAAFLRGTTLGEAAEARARGRAAGREEALLRGADAILRGRANELEVEREERQERGEGDAEPPSPADELFPAPRDEVTLGDLRWADAVFWSRAMALPLELTAESAEDELQRGPGGGRGGAADAAPTLTTVVEGIVPGLDFANAASAAAAETSAAPHPARPNAVWAVVGDDVMLASPPGSGLLPGDDRAGGGRGGVGRALGRVLGGVWGVVARVHAGRGAGKDQASASRARETVPAAPVPAAPAPVAPAASGSSAPPSSPPLSPSREVFIDYGSKSNEELLFAYGFTLEPSPQDALMLPGTLPSIGVKDETEAATRVEVLNALGSFPPQIFLPILVTPEEERERNADAKPKAKAKAKAEADSPDAPAMWRVGSRYLPAHTKEVLEALVAPYEEVLARARALERGNAPRHLPGFGPAPAGAAEAEPAAARAARLGNELALLSTLGAMLEKKALTMEDPEDGTGSLEADQDLLALVQAAETAAEVGVAETAAEVGAADTPSLPVSPSSPSFRRFASALRYRMEQKRAARAWLGEVRAAQQEVMRMLAAAGGVARSEGPVQDGETYGVAR